MPTKQVRTDTKRAPQRRAATPDATAKRVPPTKLDLLVRLLNRPDGADLVELAGATGWQAHSVRGAIARALKKKGHSVQSAKIDGVRRYKDRRVNGDVDAQVEALERLDLNGLRALWRRQYGSPPPLRSVELMRHLLAWRIQAAAHGGLDRTTRRRLVGSGRVLAEGLELGIGAVLRRDWKGQRVEVVVEDNGFRWNNRTYRSHSAVATAIAGSRWNGPRFFGLRDRVQ